VREITLLGSNGATISLLDVWRSFYHGMMLTLRNNLGSRRRFRFGLVATLVLALLAFPCGPFASALGLGIGHDLVAAKAATPHSEHGEAECPHRVKKHESSCCKDCSSWLTARFQDGTTVILTQASPRDLAAISLTYTRLSYVEPDRKLRLTGPPSIGFLDGTLIYSRTQRYRI
jgi:hypothetical protein